MLVLDYKQYLQNDEAQSSMLGEILSSELALHRLQPSTSGVNVVTISNFWKTSAQRNRPKKGEAFSREVDYDESESN